MNETTSDRAAVVAAFDAARDRFLAAFAEVPDEALTYLPEGDEFAIGWQCQSHTQRAIAREYANL